VLLRAAKDNGVTQERNWMRAPQSGASKNSDQRERGGTVKDRNVAYVILAWVLCQWRSVTQTVARQASTITEDSGWTE
jgi:hypothetical protein